MSVTLSPSELGSFLDAVASAPVALRDVPRINNILARLVGLANSTGPIGAIGPCEPPPMSFNKLSDAMAWMGPSGATKDIP